MKRILYYVSAVACLAFYNKVQAQHYSAQVYTGINNYYGDLNTSDRNISVGLNAGYHLKPWASLHADVQFGKLSASRDKSGDEQMSFTNNYTTVAAMGRVHFLNISPISKSVETQKYLNGLYAGVGLGIFLSNRNVYDPHVPQIGYIAEKQATDFFIPLEIGYQLPLVQFTKNTDAANTGDVRSSQLLLTAFYRYNLGFSDGWDGYKPTLSSNKNNDGMDLIAIGLQYQF